MKILLTGATGFIGSAFLRHAVEAGHELAALVRPERRAALPVGPRIHPLEGTLADAPWREIADFAPDACVHAAWVTTPGIYLESPENVQFLAWSQDFLRRAMNTGVSQIVALGTCLEYAMTGAPLAETATPLAPASAYARAKDELRRWLAAGAGGGRAVWARVFYPYGPGEHPARLATSVAQRVRRGETVTLATPASVKDYIFISDLAAALLAVVENRFHGPINLGTGEGVTVGAVAAEIAAQLGRPELIRAGEPTAPDPLAHVVADAARLRALGWRPRVPLREGVARLLRNLQP